MGVRRMCGGVRVSGVFRCADGAGLQPGEGDGDEPVHGRPGGQVAGCGEGVQAEAREFAGCGVIADGAGLYGLGEQFLDHGVEPLLCLGDLAVAVQERREVAVVVLS